MLSATSSARSAYSATRSTYCWDPNRNANTGNENRTIYLIVLDTLPVVAPGCNGARWWDKWMGKSCLRDEQVLFPGKATKQRLGFYSHHSAAGIPTDACVTDKFYALERPQNSDLGFLVIISELESLLTNCSCLQRRSKRPAENDTQKTFCTRKLRSVQSGGGAGCPL